MVSAEDISSNNENIILNENCSDINSNIYISDSDVDILDSPSLNDLNSDSNYVNDLEEKKSSKKGVNFFSSKDDKLEDIDSNKHVNIDLSLYEGKKTYYNTENIVLGIALYDDENNLIVDNATLTIYDLYGEPYYEEALYVNAYADPYFYISPNLQKGTYIMNISLENYDNISFKYDLPVFDILDTPIYHIDVFNDDILDGSYIILKDNFTTFYCNYVDDDGNIQYLEIIGVKLNDLYYLDFPSDNGIIISPLVKGQNNISLSYPGSPSGEIEYFKVVPLNLTIFAYDNESFINIDCPDVIIGNDLVINASISDYDNNILNRTFHLEIFDSTDYENIIDIVFNVTGNQSISIDKKYLLEGHDYTINAYFDGDSNYNFAPTSSKSYFTVLPRTSSIYLVKTIFNNDKDIELEFDLSNALGNGINGLINFTLNNKSYSVQTDNENGGKINVGKLRFGNYTVNANFYGDENYYPSSLCENFTVLKSVKLIVETEDVVYGESSIINFTLKTSDGLELNESALLYISNAFGENKVYVEQLNFTNGKASYTLNNITENCFIRANCYLEDEYESCVGYGSIKVIEKLPNTINATIDLNVDLNASSVIVSLNDIEGNGIPSAEILADVNGVSKNLTTDEKGQARIAISGNSTVIVSYIGNNANMSIFNKITVINNAQKNIKDASVINCKNMTTPAITKTSDRDGDYFVVTLMNSKGKSLANKPIQIGFNGKIYNKVTDEKGSAKLQINLKKVDLYTFAICFLGDDELNASFVVAKINVTPQTASLNVLSKTYKASAKNKSIIVTLKDAKKRAINGKTISLTVNGKTYSATTNSKGTAVIKASLSKKGTYSFTAKLTNDLTFKTATAKGKITIK